MRYETAEALLKEMLERGFFEEVGEDRYSPVQRPPEEEEWLCLFYDMCVERAEANTKNIVDVEAV